MKKESVFEPEAVRENLHVNTGRNATGLRSESWEVEFHICGTGRRSLPRFLEVS